MPDSQDIPRFCSHCGTLFHAGAAFCHVCGKPLTPPPFQVAPVPDEVAPAPRAERPAQVLGLLAAFVAVGLILRILILALGRSEAMFISLYANTSAYAAVRAVLLAGGFWFLLCSDKRRRITGGLILFVWLIMGPLEPLLFRLALGAPFVYYLRLFLRALLFVALYAASAALCWHFLFRRRERDKRAFLSVLISVLLLLAVNIVWFLALYKGRPPVGRAILTAVLQAGMALVSFLALRWLSRTQLKSRMRLTTWGYIWCGLCVAANIGVLITNIRNVSLAHGLIPTPAYTILISVLMVAAFVLLLCGKRSGWFLLLAVTSLQVFTNLNTLVLRLSEHADVAAPLRVLIAALINTVVTWFTIRPSWLASAPAATAAPAIVSQPTHVPMQEAASVPMREAGPAPAQPIMGSMLSLRQLRCPQCGSYDVIAKGQEGALGKSIGTSLAFGAIGSLVSNAGADARIAAAPMQYQCRSCKNKFPFSPTQPEPDELLSAPAAIEFTRDGSMVGAAVQQFVFLNGLPMGPVKNGKTITFTTGLRYNTLFVTDHFGVAFPEAYRFEALPGSLVRVRFNRKFQ